MPAATFRPYRLIFAFLLLAWGTAHAAEEAPAVPVPEVIEAALEQPTFKSHAIAMHGKPKYGPTFEYFGYVDPNAPKGGEIRFAVRGAFDSSEWIVLGVLDQRGVTEREANA